MPFGIPGSEPSGGGEFLGRINCDARTGFWTITRRIQDPNGAWTNDTTAPFQNPTFLVDFGSLEVGYMKISNPPAFLLVPMGQAIPAQPQEMTEPRPGDKPRRAFQPGFRVKVMSQKTFGDSAAYYFSGSSKTLMSQVEALWSLFCASPEAATGKVPVVNVTGSEKVVVKTPQGSSTFYAPTFAIASWADRPAALGDRTVPAPTGRQAPPAPAAPAPAAHVPPPAPAAPAAAAHVPPPAPAAPAPAAHVPPPAPAPEPQAAPAPQEAEALPF